MYILINKYICVSVYCVYTIYIYVKINDKKNV